MINIAVLGYGTVGSGVVEVIDRNNASINKKTGNDIKIKYVLDLRDFPDRPYGNKVVKYSRFVYRRMFHVDPNGVEAA